MMFWVIFVLLPAVLLVAAGVACFFRRGRRILAWTIVAAVLLVAGGRLAREAEETARSRFHDRPYSESNPTELVLSAIRQ